MTINQINFSTPFLLGVPNSRISSEWIRLLASIVDAVGNPNVISSDEFQAFVFTSREPVDKSGDINELRNAQFMSNSALRGSIRDLMRRIEDLEAQIPKKQAPLPFLLTADDVSALIRPKTGSASDAVSVMDDTTTNATVYPVWCNGLSGQRQVRTSSSKLSFNPSTGTVTLTGVLAVTGSATFSGTINKVTLTQPTTGATLTLADNSTLSTVGAFAVTLTATAATNSTLPAGTFNLGYLEVPQNSKSAAYTTVLADSGKHIYHPGADTTARIWTIDSNANVAYPVGTALTFVNDTSAGVITIAITSDTLVLAGAGTTGSRTLAANGIATALKMTSTRWMISGTGLT